MQKTSIGKHINKDQPISDMAEVRQFTTFFFKVVKKMMTY